MATRAELERLVALPETLPRDSTHTPVGWTAGDQPAARARLLEAIATGLAALVAGPVPGLIAVEDLQWADDASREALAWLGAPPRRASAPPDAHMATRGSRRARDGLCLDHRGSAGGHRCGASAVWIGPPSSTSWLRLSRWAFPSWEWMRCWQ